MGSNCGGGGGRREGSWEVVVVVGREAWESIKPQKALYGTACIPDMTTPSTPSMRVT